MVVGCLAALGFLLYFESLSARLACVFTLIYCTSQVAFRMGLYNGFVRGFQQGKEAGVYRALGISPEDASEISEKATEMELDGILIEKLDERKGRPGAV